MLIDVSPLHDRCIRANPFLLLGWKKDRKREIPFVQCYTVTYSNSGVVYLFLIVLSVLCHCKVLQETHIASLSPCARIRSIFILEFIIIIL